MQEPPSLIEQIKHQGDLLVFARDTLGIEMKKKGREWVGLCPIHSERTPSFYVNQEKQVFICRGCGAGGDLINLAEQVNQLSVGDAILWLARHYGIETKERRPRPTNRRPSSKDPLDDASTARHVLTAVARYFTETLDLHEAPQSYLRSRSIRDSEVALYQIGYAPSDYDLVTEVSVRVDQESPSTNTITDILMALGLLRYDRQPFFVDRIMFPVADATGAVVGFSGRRLNDDPESPKYVNSTESRLFQKKAILYGLAPFAHLSKDKRESWRMLVRQPTVTVVEGFTDVIAMARHGFHAVATMGTAITDEHLRTLQRRSNDEVIFCFDGDKAGRQAAWRVTRCALEMIRDGNSWGLKLLPDEVDVDDMLSDKGPEAFMALPVISCSHYWLSQSLKPIQERDTLDRRVRLWRDFAQLKAHMGPNAPVLAALMEGEIQRQLGNTPLPLREIRQPMLPPWHGRPLHPAVTDLIRMAMLNPAVLAEVPGVQDHAWGESRLQAGDEPAFAGLKLILFAQLRLSEGRIGDCAGAWGLLQALSEAGMPSDWIRAWAQAAPPARPPAVPRQRRAQIIEQWGGLIEVAIRQQKQYPIWALATRGS